MNDDEKTAIRTALKEHARAGRRMATTPEFFDGDRTAGELHERVKEETAS
jgi:hypothetical protein